MEENGGMQQLLTSEYKSPSRRLIRIFFSSTTLCIDLHCVNSTTLCIDLHCVSSTTLR